ncbi:MAG: pilus assembly protein [Acidobacteriia bacterium]|nr:pilus assembly protein [Terriglobia bacterium]
MEFALSFMLLWALMGGAFHLGYSIFVYQSLVSAVAGAARYASHVDFDSAGHTFVPIVQNMAAYGSPTAGPAALAPSLTPANINVTWTTDATGVPVTMTVSIVHYTIGAVFRSFTWSGKPSVTVRWAGRYLT